MTEPELKTLIDAMAPVIREYVAKEIRALEARLAILEARAVQLEALQRQRGAAA